MPFTVLHCCWRKVSALRRKSTGDRFENGTSGSWTGRLAGDGGGMAKSCSLFSSPVATPLNPSAHAGIYKHSMPAIFLNLASVQKPPSNERAAKFFVFCFLLSAIVRESKRQSRIQCPSTMELE